VGIVIDRFTNEARRTLTLADAETKRLHRLHTYTDTFLIALLGIPEGLAAQALQEAGVSIETVRGAMGEVSSDSESSSLSDEARKATKRSQTESRGREHTFIGTEHLLLALLDDNEGVAARLLANLGVDLAALRQNVVDKMPGTNEGSFDMSKRHMARLEALRQ
jgi:ATP-dependent Clp protease ATP-binding subunit ClpC